ncbi:hypothetical protein [Streptomyces sp. NBC_00151]|uniref:hypothetical protein n=1 Tax=Streptomyces sp. NBC_00151 TaxID=2975669 RepID=UPI002DDC83BD|nr:hypothetical protein [Streptomyces sp. NBC_00151]WRZ43505.1 hypothetical protein OG915_38950 [Streptomyces sp. NBC_00151]
MSFDLAVWFESERVSASRAADTYERLADGDFVGAGVVASEAVPAFRRELTGRFPELSATEADGPRPTGSPWTARLDVSAAHVIMPMSWDRADAMAPEVVALAGRHGLVCFDPQAEVLHLPPALRGADGLSLQPCVGLKVEDADLDVIERAVHRLSEENWFLILEKRTGHFLQVGHGPNAGLTTGGFAVEHRDGAMERHYRCVLNERDQVATLFADYASGASAWSVDTRWDSLF